MRTRPAAHPLAIPLVGMLLLQAAAGMTQVSPASPSAIPGSEVTIIRYEPIADPVAPPEQVVLLDLARRSIAAKIQGVDLPPLPMYSDGFGAIRGCFVNLYMNGTMRGSVGTVWPTLPLAAAIQRYAVAAALEDRRFEPLTAADMPQVTIEISVLTELRPLPYADADELLAKLRPGVDGVVVTDQEGRRATFLPQVWTQAPEKTVFLDNLCRRAGMAPNAWRNPGAVAISVYESFAFRDPAR